MCFLRGSLILNSISHHLLLSHYLMLSVELCLLLEVHCLLGVEVVVMVLAGSVQVLMSLILNWVVHLSVS